MKLIIAIAHERDKHKLGDALLQSGLTFTKLGSTGGFLRQGNVTVLIVPALNVLPPHPIRVEAGGAVAFVLQVDSFARF